MRSSDTVQNSDCKTGAAFVLLLSAAVGVCTCCIYLCVLLQYWDSHCSTFSKLPALALVNPSSSCPRGLSPALFLELLSRLTDLQEWQIWDLWSSLDVHACGFVSVRCLCFVCPRVCVWVNWVPHTEEGV